MYRRKKCLREELDDVRTPPMSIKQFIKDNKHKVLIPDLSGVEDVVCVDRLEAFMEGKVVVDADWLKKLWNMAETQPVLKHEIEAMLATQEGE